MFWSNPTTFVNARVVTPQGRLARTIRIKNRRVDGIDVAPDRNDVIVDLADSFVFPGLINAHDHLELNSQPRLKWRDRYDNASEWIADFQPRFDSDPTFCALLNNGVDCSAHHGWISTVHSDDDLDRTVQAYERAFRALAAERAFDR